jgi:hypothetical protein
MTSSALRRNAYLGQLQFSPEPAPVKPEPSHIALRMQSQVASTIQAKL